jgi:hypothetical protein
MTHLRSFEVTSARNKIPNITRCGMGDIILAPRRERVFRPGERVKLSHAAGVRGTFPSSAAGARLADGRSWSRHFLKLQELLDLTA